jgi:hypothetical protein
VIVLHIIIFHGLGVNRGMLQLIVNRMSCRMSSAMQVPRSWPGKCHCLALVGDGEQRN